MNMMICDFIIFDTDTVYTTTDWRPFQNHEGTERSAHFPNPPPPSIDLGPKSFIHDVPLIIVENS